MTGAALAVPAFPLAGSAQSRTLIHVQSTVDDSVTPASTFSCSKLPAVPR